MRCVLALAFVAIPSAANAKEHVVEVAWTAAGEYRAELSLAQGKLKEACVALRAGDRVQWNFESDAETAFNIHYHEGEKVTYPAKKDGIRADRGVLEVAVPETYCWMWRASAGPAKVDVFLKQIRR